MTRFRLPHLRTALTAVASLPLLVSLPAVRPAVAQAVRSRLPAAAAPARQAASEDAAAQLRSDDDVDIYLDFDDPGTEPIDSAVWHSRDDRGASRARGGLGWPISHAGRGAHAVRQSAWTGPCSDAGICPTDCWTLQLLPDGLIYRSYLAGTNEPRIAGTAFRSEQDSWFLDVSLGGRVGILRCGTTDTRWPEGWQVDIEGAALPRLNLEKSWDMESSDFRFGVPLTYGVGNVQTKFAYYHLSSHLGDELVIREPSLLATRINFSRDVLVLGVSYFAHPAWRLYAESGWAFHSDGGSEPWEFQFGTEIAPPDATSSRGAPFLAVNGHLREEVDFGGDLVMQAGWAWRGPSGRLFRLGAHWLTGMSNQFQFHDRSARQIGLGLWYDF